MSNNVTGQIWHMLDELEALIGHVYVVGGRAVSATPPGALVELPPRKPQRGREQDTFFTLVTPAGSTQGQATFYEQLARLAADLYFQTSGGVTSGLREAVGVVNNNLIEHNVVAGQRYEANMICLVLRGHEVYVARAGACLCLLRQGDSFITLPDDLRDEYALNGLPLGYSPVPDIKLSHYEIAPKHVMILADAGFAQADRQDLNDALGAGNLQSIIEPLKTLGGNKAQAVVIEFVSVDTPDPTVQAPPTGLRITRSSAAPTAAPASPLSATGLAAPVKSVAAPPTPPKPAPKPKSDPVRSPAPNAASVAAEPLPPIREIAAETTQNASRAGRRAVGGVASFLSAFTKGLSALLDRLLPEPEEGGPQIPAMLAAGLAILVPVVIVFIVVALRLSQADMTEFERQVQDVQAAADQASTIPITEQDRSKTVWVGVLQRIDNVELSSGRTDDATLEGIRAKAQGILDNYAKVTRRTAIPIRSFSDSAKLRGPIIQGGTSMYTLEIKSSAISRDTLNQTSNMVAARSAQPVVQKSQAVGSRSVQQLIDIVWMPEGGIPRANVLAALDTQGLLITYSPTFAPATSQSLPGSDLWVNPVAIATWQGRFYILDAGANQIWRYLPTGITYPDAPEEYFAATSKPDLKDAVDFAIDGSGNIFVLFSNGTLKRFNGGAEQPFSFNGLPDGSLKSANAMYLDNDSTLPAIYITDPLDQSVYQVTLAGTFRFRFRATDNAAFRQLTGVYVDQNRVYVASGSLIYTFTMEDKPDATPTP
ncbi:MAG: hypothetical protein ABI947_20005 [Chloroflexota bacterium]